MTTNPKAFAHGTAVVASNDGTPSVIVCLIIPIDDDLLFTTTTAVTLAAKVAAAVGKRGQAAVFLNPLEPYHPELGDPEP